MGCRKRPRDATVEGGRLRGLYHKAWDMLMVFTFSIVILILNSSLLPTTGEVREYTDQ